jgi:hypothetical protein
MHRQAQERQMRGCHAADPNANLQSHDGAAKSIHTAKNNKGCNPTANLNSETSLHARGEIEKQLVTSRIQKPKTSNFGPATTWSRPHAAITDWRNKG